MALNWGGAIFVGSKSCLTMTDSTILNSTALEGGVFFVSDSSVALSNSLIVNSSVPRHGGVVFFTQGGTLFFTGCTIAHSEADSGGVMYVAMDRSADSNTVFSNCTIRESKAHNHDVAHGYSGSGYDVRGGAFHINSNGCVTITGS
eukprot:5687468-Prymnesium_polylepis.1